VDEGKQAGKGCPAPSCLPSPDDPFCKPTEGNSLCPAITAKSKPTLRKLRRKLRISLVEKQDGVTKQIGIATIMSRETKPISSKRLFRDFTFCMVIKMHK
jgi:hypothetical protein